jgi:carbon starvation protein
MTPIGFAVFLALIYVAQTEGLFLGFAGLLDSANQTITAMWVGPGAETALQTETMVDWLSALLLVYALVASVLPVWVLLQPRDFLNVLLLFLGLGSLYLGVFVGAPEFAAPAVNPNPEGAPSMFPFVFIVIACGAASGFHSLVSSGTTAKQLDRETDARAIGYGGMIGESLLGLIAVLATTAGFAKSAEWHQQYGSWEKVSALGSKIANFINGAGTFLESIGIPLELGASFVSVIVVSYALTSLDSATRLLRYNVEEVGETLGLEILGNRFVSGAIAAAAIGFFAFYEIDGKPAGLTLWSLFGTTNQLMAGLALLVVTLYLLMRDKNWWVTGIPMVAMLGTTLLAMASNVGDFFQAGNYLLLAVGGLLLILGIWTVIEATIAIVAYRAEKSE